MRKVQRLLLVLITALPGCVDLTGIDLTYSGGGALVNPDFAYDAMGQGTYWIQSGIHYFVDTRTRNYTTRSVLLLNHVRLSPNLKSMVTVESGTGGKSEVRVFGWNDSAATVIVSDDFIKNYPSWSFNGASVFFMRQDNTPQRVNIVRASLLPGAPVTIINPLVDAQCATINSTGPVSESPDGTLAFLAWRAEGGKCTGPDLYTIRGDGSNKQYIASPTIGSAFFSPAWSPDGTRIAVGVRVRKGPYLEDYSTSVLVINADRSNATFSVAASTNSQSARSTDNDAVCWSADGARILFMAPGNVAADIYSVRPDGSALQKIIWAEGLACGR